MKKIGIMTLFNNNNFGAALQAYALQYLLNKKSYKSEDISYYRVLPGNNNKTKVKRILTNIKNSILHPVSMFRIEQKKKIYREFVDNNIKYSSRIYNKQSIGEALNNYDCFICGSDNIWNKNLLDTSYMLDFVTDDVKKIAYAPGMSTTELTIEQKKVMLPLIDRINFLSCREKIGCDLLEGCLNRKVFHAMDPTLLLTSEEWISISEKSDMDIKEQYIFALIYGNSPEKCDIVNFIRLKMNMDVVAIPFGTGYYNKNDIKLGTKSVYKAGPLDMLKLIQNSQFVVTDTFHATVFSVLFHKNFISLRRFKNTRSAKLDLRIDGMLDKLKINKDHIIEDLTDKNAIEKALCSKIDYSQVDFLLEAWRKDSIEFLINALEK